MPEAIEAQCVENLQREDIHPLEEALGFKITFELGEPAYKWARTMSPNSANYFWK